MNLELNNKSLYIIVMFLISAFIITRISYTKRLSIAPKCDSCYKTKSINIPPAAHEEQSKTIKVMIKSGDSFTGILKSIGLSETESYYVTQSLKNIYNVDKIKYGDHIILTLNAYNELSNIKIQSQFSAKNVVVNKDRNNRYSCTLEKILQNKKIVHVSDTISHSLFNTIANKGLPATTIMRLAELYNGNIDLNKQILPGSKVDILLERSFDENGESISDDKILYTSLKVEKKNINMYRHLLQNGKYGYFNSEGKNIKKSVLQLPINTTKTRISSKFGNRVHPIHGYIKLHKGIDYAAPMGTPIRASADGIIEYIGTKSGYGKYIRIKHNDDYSTAYAHIRNFHSDLIKGSKIQQGQIIAYVGNSGASTAPHLHYEVLYKGTHIDPQKVLAINEITELPETELLLFQSTIQKIHTIIDEYSYGLKFAINE